jgi:hypothetical protein
MSNISFTVTPLTGDVLSTTFKVLSVTTPNNILKYVWNFGTEEQIYDTPAPSFIYKAPGIYTISLTAVDSTYNVLTFNQQITAEYPYRDYIKFLEIPNSFADPGKKTNRPFKIEVLTTNINSFIIVDLFAANSKSTPYQFVPDKWSAITPTWKFLDKDLNTVTSLSVVSSPVYKNNVVVAVSGTSEFYYVDSTSAGDPTINCPILISAVVQTSGFKNKNDSTIYSYNSHANNLFLRTGTLWQVNDLFPNTLKVTGNYYNSIHKKQWKEIPIPVLITCHSDRSLLIPGTEKNLSEVLFSYPATNKIGKIAPLTLSLSGFSNNQYLVNDAPLYFQATDINNNRSSGYVFTTITPLQEKNNVCIFAQTTANIALSTTGDEFLYPGLFGPNSEVWVSNPQKNTLNKITLIPDNGNCNTINFYKTNKILTDGYIKEIEVPLSVNSSTTNYELSGFSGIYSVAIDPRNYDIIACDAELDKIYRITNEGEIIKTFELSSIDTYNARQSLCHSWSWITPSPEVSSSRFAFYGPTLFSSNSANYIVMVGGVIQPSEILEIDSFANTARIYLYPKYAPEALRFDLLQIFHPSLPSSYISSLMAWTSTATLSTSSFYLPTTLSLTGDPTQFIVSVDGVLQHPDTYTIDSNTIHFSETVPLSTTLYTLYVPNIQRPAFWKRKFEKSPFPNFVYSLEGSDFYIPDQFSSFIVNIGGKLQLPTAYQHDVVNKRLIFFKPLPQNVDISVTQLFVPDTINIPAAITPTYVSLDRNYNIWVTLYNAVSVLKFDSDLNLSFSVVPNNIQWQKRAWINNPIGIDWQSSYFGNTSRYFDATAGPTDPYYNEFFAKPAASETDQNNNCWVTYSHPLCSFIVKYSSTGEQLLTINTGPYSTPINIAVNAQNNIWVTNFHGSSYYSTFLSGSLVLYDNTTGSVLSSITGISRPGHIAVDRFNNVWFSHGLRRIGFLNTKTATISSWTLELTGGFTPYDINLPGEIPELYEQEDNLIDEQIGGLSVDAYNRVWVLDNLQNYAWVLSATSDLLNSTNRFFKIRPNATIGYYPDLETGNTYTEAGNYYYRSAQATGDWTGNKWYQKYATPDLLFMNQISGVSDIFSVNEFINPNQIKKINDSFNTAEYYRTLALPENLNSNNILFNSFLPAIVGNGQLSANEDIGQTVYEKIANYVINHSDIDTCNIKQLLSYAEALSINVADYATTIPAEIANMIDLASIPRSKLWGIKDTTPILSESLGTLYNTQTDYLTAETQIILKNKVNSALTLVSVPPLTINNTTITVYPVSSFEGYGFIQPVPVNYLIYRYVPSFANKSIENIIDWDSPYTTQSYNLSTNKDWYEDDGAIENTFRYLLTKNLFLK